MDFESINDKVKKGVAQLYGEEAADGYILKFRPLSEIYFFKDACKQRKNFTIS